MRRVLVAAVLVLVLGATCLRFVPSSAIGLRSSSFSSQRAVVTGILWAPRGFYGVETVRPGSRVLRDSIDLSGRTVPVEITLRCALDLNVLASNLRAQPDAWLLPNQVLDVLRRSLASRPGGDFETALAEAGRSLQRRLTLEQVDRLVVGDRDSDFGFSSSAEREALPKIAKATPVLFVGIDAGDWEVMEPLLFSGQLPHFLELFRGGAHGVLRGSRPLLSPLLWTTMATGVDAYEHGVKDFITAGVPTTSSTRRVPAFWNRFSALGIDSLTVAWWATYPAEWVRGSLISDRVAYSLLALSTPEQGLTHPESLGREAARLASQTEVSDDLLLRFVRLSPDAIREARKLEQAGDLRDPVAHLIRTLRGMRTYHSLALDLIERRPAPIAAVYYQAVDEVCHRFAAARPPAVKGQESREATQGGAVDAIYRYQDELLGELVGKFRQRQGSQARIIVVSDHGFFTGADRPASLDPFEAQTASLWHRPDGIFLATGPGIVQGELPPLDQTQVLPILLAAAGVPPPAELPGRVPDRLFEAPPASISWPPLLVQRLDPPEPGEIPSEPADAQRLEELKRLGYIGDEANRGVSVNEILVDAFHFESSGDDTKALEILDKGLEKSGHSEAVAMATVELALKTKQFEKADRILGEMEREGQGGDALPILETAAWLGLNQSTESIRSRLEARKSTHPMSTLMAFCDLAIARNDTPAAISALREALALDPRSPMLLQRLSKIPRPVPAELLDLVRAAVAGHPSAAALQRWLGERLQEAGQWPDAEATFRQLLQAQPANRELLEHWAMAALMNGHGEAVIAELEAVGRAGAQTQGTRAVLATAYALGGRAEPAIELYQGLLENEPGRLEFYRPLVELLLSRGRSADAIRWVDRGLTQAQGKPEESVFRELRSRAESQTPNR